MNFTAQYTLLLVILLFASTQLYSQVTIGSDIRPTDGSMLDLKETDTSGANSTKGLLLPRVKLTQKNSLVDISDVDYVNTNEQQAHVGLTVYNINPNFDKGQGLHFWDGTKWLSTKPDTITKIEKDTIIVMRKDTVTLTVNTDKIYFTGMANDGNSLLNVGVAGNTWRTLVFKTVPIDSKASYNSTTGVFRINSSGTFNLYARYVYSGAGIAQTVGVAIYKKAVGQSTFSQIFKDESTIIIGLTGGVRTITQSNVVLNAGDELVFSLQTGGLNLSIANGGSSAFATINQN